MASDQTYQAYEIQKTDLGALLVKEGGECACAGVPWAHEKACRTKVIGLVDEVLVAGSALWQIEQIFQKDAMADVGDYPETLLARIRSLAAREGTRFPWAEVDRQAALRGQSDAE